MRFFQHFLWLKPQFFLSCSTILSVFLYPACNQAFISHKLPRLSSQTLSSISQPNDAVDGTEQKISTVVFIRHGESTFNNRNVFTGWCDIDLTERGVQEAYDAGVLLASHGFTFDTAHTSVLKRATKSTHKVLLGMDKTYTPIQTSWKLNERHYGALQGKNKATTEEAMGQIVVQWRRSYSTRPPEMLDSHPHWLMLANDARYKGIPIPRTESLKDTEARVFDYWTSDILPEMKGGKSVLVVAHANTLRALVKSIDGISDVDIEKIYIPTGVPFVYTFDHNLHPLGKPDSTGFRGFYLKGMSQDPCVRQYLARKHACEVKFSENPEVVPEECILPVLDGCLIEPDFFNDSEASGNQDGKGMVPSERMVGEPDPQPIPFLQNADEEGHDIKVLPKNAISGNKMKRKLF